MTRRLDLKKWNEKRIPIEERITALKELIQTPGRGGSWKEYRDLGQLQDDATILYMARAEQRNKLHALVRTRYIFNPEMVRGRGLTLGSARAEELGIPQNIKVIDPVTREEQQAAILNHPLLADLYKSEPQVVLGLGAEAFLAPGVPVENGAGTLLTTIYEGTMDAAAALERRRKAGG